MASRSSFYCILLGLLLCISSFTSAAENEQESVDNVDVAVEDTEAEAVAEDRWDRASVIDDEEERRPRGLLAALMGYPDDFEDVNPDEDDAPTGRSTYVKSTRKPYVVSASLSGVKPFKKHPKQSQYAAEVASTSLPATSLPSTLLPTPTASLTPEAAETSTLKAIAISSTESPISTEVPILSTNLSKASSRSTSGTKREVNAGGSQASSGLPIPAGYILWHPVPAHLVEGQVASSSEPRPIVENPKEKIHPHQPFFIHAPSIVSPSQLQNGGFPISQFSIPQMIVLPPTEVTGSKGKSRNNNREKSKKQKSSRNNNRNKDPKGKKPSNDDDGPRPQLPPDHQQMARPLPPNRFQSEFPSEPFFPPNEQMFFRNPPNFQHNGPFRGPQEQLRQQNGPFRQPNEPFRHQSEQFRQPNEQFRQAFPEPSHQQLRQHRPPLPSPPQQQQNGQGNKDQFRQQNGQGNNDQFRQQHGQGNDDQTRQQFGQGNNDQFKQQDGQRNNDQFRQQNGQGNNDQFKPQNGQGNNDQFRPQNGQGNNDQFRQQNGQFQRPNEPFRPFQNDFLPPFQPFQQTRFSPQFQPFRPNVDTQHFPLGSSSQVRIQQNRFQQSQEMKEFPQQKRPQKQQEDNKQNGEQNEKRPQEQQRPQGQREQLPQGLMDNFSPPNFPPPPPPGPNFFPGENRFPPQGPQFPPQDFLPPPRPSPLPTAHPAKFQIEHEQRMREQFERPNFPPPLFPPNRDMPPPPFQSGGPFMPPQRPDHIFPPPLPQQQPPTRFHSSSPRPVNNVNNDDSNDGKKENALENQTPSVVQPTQNSLTSASIAEPQFASPRPQLNRIPTEPPFVSSPMPLPPFVSSPMPLPPFVSSTPLPPFPSSTLMPPFQPSTPVSPLVEPTLMPPFGLNFNLSPLYARDYSRIPTSTAASVGKESPNDRENSSTEKSKFLSPLLGLPPSQIQQLPVDSLPQPQLPVGDVPHPPFEHQLRKPEPDAHHFRSKFPPNGRNVHPNLPDFLPGQFNQQLLSTVFPTEAPVPFVSTTTAPLQFAADTYIDDAGHVDNGHKGFPSIVPPHPTTPRPSGRRNKSKNKNNSAKKVTESHGELFSSSSQPTVFQYDVKYNTPILVSPIPFTSSHS